MILLLGTFKSNKKQELKKEEIPVKKADKKLNFYKPIVKRPNISKLDMFLNLIEANGFLQLDLKFAKNYLLYQHPNLLMFYLRVYPHRYAIFPLCNSNEWLYKEESFNNFDYDSKDVIFELLKNNEFTNNQLTNK